MYYGVKMNAHATQSGGWLGWLRTCTQICNILLVNIFIQVGKGLLTLSKLIGQFQVFMFLIDFDLNPKQDYNNSTGQFDAL